MKQSGIEETRAESVRTPDPRYFTEGDIPMNPKSIRDNLKKDNMISSEESIRLIYEMGKMELFELRQIINRLSVSFLPEARTQGINIL